MLRNADKNIRVNVNIVGRYFEKVYLEPFGGKNISALDDIFGKYSFLTLSRSMVPLKI